VIAKLIHHIHSINHHHDFRELVETVIQQVIILDLQDLRFWMQDLPLTMPAPFNKVVSLSGSALTNGRERLKVVVFNLESVFFFYKISDLISDTCKIENYFGELNLGTKFKGAFTVVKSHSNMFAIEKMPIFSLATIFTILSPV
jgi:hypothetical protein